MAFAMCFFFEMFFAFSFDESMNWPCYCSIVAVPRRKRRPPDVTGLYAVPILAPASAVERLPRLAPVTGLLVPGRM